MNQQLEKLNQQAISENLKLKLSLIEDIINCKKQLYGFGREDQKEAVITPEKTFDRLYERDINTLELQLAYVSAQLSQAARNLIGMDGTFFVGFRRQISPDADNTDLD